MGESYKRIMLSVQRECTERKYRSGKAVERESGQLTNARDVLSGRNPNNRQLYSDWRKHLICFLGYRHWMCSTVSSSLTLNPETKDVSVTRCRPCL